MYQSGRAGDEAKKRKSPAKSRRVGITVICNLVHAHSQPQHDKKFVHTIKIAGVTSDLNDLEYMGNY